MRRFHHATSASRERRTAAGELSRRRFRDKPLIVQTTSPTVVQFPPVYAHSELGQLAESLFWPQQNSSMYDDAWKKDIAVLMAVSFVDDPVIDRGAVYQPARSLRKRSGQAAGGRLPPAAIDSAARVLVISKGSDLFPG